MRRRKVILTIEAGTVTKLRDLRKVDFIQFENGDRLYVDATMEHGHGSNSSGTIEQVQVNVVTK